MFKPRRRFTFSLTLYSIPGEIQEDAIFEGWVPVEGWFKTVLNRPHTRACMDWIPVTAIMTAILFTSWVLLTSFRINKALEKLTKTDDLLEDLGDDIAQVVLILQKLPELMPQFSVQQGNGIAELLIQKLFGVEDSLSAALPARNAEGQFDGTQTK